MHVTQVPRVHTLSWTKIRSTEDLPVITFKSSAERQAQVADLRQAALSYLETLLVGDRVAAQYLLLQLVSRFLLSGPVNPGLVICQQHDKTWYIYCYAPVWRLAYALQHMTAASSNLQLSQESDLWVPNGLNEKFSKHTGED